MNVAENSVLVKCNKYEFSFMAAIYCYFTFLKNVEKMSLVNNFASLTYFVQSKMIYWCLKHTKPKSKLLGKMEFEWF